MLPVLSLMMYSKYWVTKSFTLNKRPVLTLKAKCALSFLKAIHSNWLSGKSTASIDSCYMG